MATPLRAFLMVRSSHGEWTVEVFRDLEDIVRGWRDRAQVRDVAAVVHVGFERPSTRAFDSVTAQFAGRVLLTASAKYALTAGYKASSDPVAEIDGLPLFLAISGWGYEASDVKIVSTKPKERQLVGWLADFIANRPETEEELRNAGVLDDQAYLESEHGLSCHMRLELGLFRFEKLIGVEGHDPCAIVRAAPPWLRDRLFTEVELTNRLHNVFKRENIIFVRDLDRYTLEKLMALANFGRTSARDLVSALMRALEDGPPQNVDFDQHKGSIEGPAETTLIAEMRAALADFQSRSREIISRRMGLNRAPETLAEIGLSYNITRERVRQIEAKLLPVFFARGLWHKRLIHKITKILTDREFPLPVVGIEAADPWFAGVDQACDALQYILQNSSNNDIETLNVDSFAYLAHMNQEKWDSIVAEARRILSSGTENNWTEDRCKVVVGGLLPHSAREFSDLLWKKASASAHFTVNEFGNSTLTSFGRGAEHIVQAVLEEAETPLHYSEIAARASRRAAREIDIRRAHNAAAEVGILLGRGTYGVAKHLPISAEEMKTLAYEAEGIISSGSPGRQWHAEELLDDLTESGSQIALSVDKYVLNAALAKSEDLQSLGRLIWTQRCDDADEVGRLDVRQAVIAILQQAGHPLSAGDIHKMLVDARGVNQHFQIHAAPPLIRVGPAIWGLNDRDVVIKLPDQPKLFDIMSRSLEKRGVGIHISELRGRLPDIPGLTAEAVFSLSTQDPRLRVSLGQYLYLVNWGGPRRETIIEAVTAVLQNAPHALSPGELTKLVQGRIGRPCDRAAILRTLVNIDATLESDGRYSNPAQSDQMPVEPERAVGACTLVASNHG